MKTFDLSIGSNNRTKKLELTKIRNTVNRYFLGYTIQKTLGYWKGKPERTALVTIATPDLRKVQKLAQHLKRDLKQEAVMLTQIGITSFI